MAFPVIYDLLYNKLRMKISNVSDRMNDMNASRQRNVEGTKSDQASPLT